MLCQGDVGVRVTLWIRVIKRVHMSIKIRLRSGIGSDQCWVRVSIRFRVKFKISEKVRMRVMVKAGVKIRFEIRMKSQGKYKDLSQGKSRGRIWVRIRIQMKGRSGLDQYQVQSNGDRVKVRSR